VLVPGKLHRDVGRGDRDRVRGAADQVHLDALVVAIPCGAMIEGTQVERSAQLAVDSDEQILVERGGHSKRIVIGELQVALRLDEIRAQQEQIAQTLEDDAQVMSDAQLQEQIAGQPEDIQNEIIRINTEARPLALQIALFVPILAGLAGLGTSFRMIRIPDPKPAGTGEGSVLG